MILLDYNYNLIMKTKHLFSIGLVAVLMCALLASCKNEEETTPKNPSWNVEPGKELPKTPTTQIGDGKVKVFEQVVKVDDGNVVNFDCDTVNNHYSVTFSGAVPEDVKPGKVLVVNKDKELTVVLVTGVEKSGNTAELEGLIGDLSYVFYDTEFAIAGDPSLVDNKDIPVYTPQNNEISLSKVKIGEIKFSQKINDWNFSFKCSDEVKPTYTEDANGYRCSINTKVTPSFSINYKKGTTISGEVTISGEIGMNTNFSFVYWNRYGKPVCERQADYDFYKAETLEQQFYIDGELSFVPSFTVEAKGEISTDDIGKKVHLGEMLGVPISTPIGDVYFALDWFADASFSCSAAATLKFNDNKAKVGLTGRLGHAEYTDGSGSMINSIKLINDDPNISLSAQCGMNLSFAIYPLLSGSWLSKKGLGLGIGIKPVAEADIKLKGEATTSPTEHNYVSTSGSFTVTPKICFGAVHEKWLKDETKFYPIPISIGEKGVSTTYQMTAIKGDKFEGFEKLKTDGDFLEIFPPFFKLECPGALHIKSIKDGESSKTFQIADVDKDKMENNIIDFPIKKGVPITISFSPYTLMTWDYPGLTTVRVNGDKLVNFSFPPNVIYLKSSDPNFSDWVFGCYPEYTWTPISDTDYLEATICDASGDVKGYCKIRNSNAPLILTVGVGETTVEKDSPLVIWGSADGVCDIVVYVDGNEIKRLEKTTNFSVELPTSISGTHTVVISAKANGRRSCNNSFEYIVTDPEPPYNPVTGDGYVDLGLPSGTLWATCNVGAKNPWDYGDYFAWGETKPKDDYSWSTYKYANGWYDKLKLTKYCNNSSYGNDGYTDNLTVLQPEDDAATVNMGSNWRMPTQAELQELYDNCDWEWTSYYNGGVSGYIVKSRNTSNSLFLPAAGYRFGGDLYRAGSSGYYWSSSLPADGPDIGRRLYFDSGYVNPGNWGTRLYGQSVRPVRCR